MTLHIPEFHSRLAVHWQAADASNRARLERHSHGEGYPPGLSLHADLVCRGCWVQLLVPVATFLRSGLCLSDRLRELTPCRGEPLSCHRMRVRLSPLNVNATESQDRNAPVVNCRLGVICSHVQPGEVAATIFTRSHCRVQSAGLDNATEGAQCRRAPVPVVQHRTSADRPVG
jgi:hypothetical protein